MKKISTCLVLLLFLTISLGAVSQKEKFLYRYQIKANSNSAGDLISLYQEKEFFLLSYEKLILFLDPALHVTAIKDNLAHFPKTGIAAYENGLIIITIGQGKGTVLSGELKTSSCDQTVVNKKIFLLEWLFS